MALYLWQGDVAMGYKELSLRMLPNVSYLDSASAIACFQSYVLGVRYG